MGQKVNPHGLRVGIIKDWDSKWYANKKNFSNYLVEDFKIREFVKKELFTAGIARVYIDRLANERVHINIFTAKPGMIVGRGGESIKTLKDSLEALTKKEVKLDISEVQNVDSDAQLVAENVAFSLERRVSFRRAMKQVMGRAMRAGALGIKVMVSGRLNGAEIARSESYAEGNVPLSTLRANIDYGFAEADTAYGKIGVKIWIYTGEVLPQISEATRLVRKEARTAKASAPNAKKRRPSTPEGKDNRGKRPQGNRKPQGDRRPQGER